MTSTYQEEDDRFIIASENIKKEIIEIDEDEIEINMDDGDEANCVDGQGKGGNDYLIKETVYYVNNSGGKSTDEVNFEKIKSDYVGSVKNNQTRQNTVNHNEEDKNNDNDEDNDEITKEDVEAIYNQLVKVNKMLQDEIYQLKNELQLTRCQSVINLRTSIQSDINNIIKQLQWLTKQNVFLKSCCLNKLCQRFKESISYRLNGIQSVVKSSTDSIVQSKINLDFLESPGSNYRCEKSSQTIRTMACKGSEKTEELKDEFISHLKQRNIELNNQLIKEKSSLHCQGPDVMLVKKEDYLRMWEKTRSSTKNKGSGNNNNDNTNNNKSNKSNRRTNLAISATTNCDQSNNNNINSSTKSNNSRVIKKESATNFKVNFNKHFQISSTVSNTDETKQQINSKVKTPPTNGRDDNNAGSSSNGTKGDIRRQFYTCKCGQQFSKNTLGYKAAYDSFRKHVARCSIYMKNGAVCDICDAPFHSIPCLKVHIRRIHPERPELLEKYRHIVSCPCGKVFDNYSQECTAIKALRKHARACPSYHSKAIFCYICKEPFLEPNQLNNHIRMAHSVKPNGSESISKASTSSALKRKKVDC